MENRYALLIGCSSYRSRRIADLPQVKNSIDQLHKILIDEEIGQFKRENVIPLTTSRTTTKIAIAKAIEDMAKRPSSEHDTVLVYYCGHGTRSIVDQEPHLFACDTDPDTYNTMITEDELRKPFIRRGSKRVVFIIDACKSGGFTQGSSEDPSLTLQIPEQDEGIYTITSSGKTEDAFTYDISLGDSPYTVFSHVVIEGLITGDADIKRDRTIDPEELFDYVSQRLSYAKQTPTRQVVSQRRGLTRIAIAFNRQIPETATIPLWTQTPKPSLDQIILSLHKLLAFEHRPQIDILKELYSPRNCGTKNIPETFKLDVRIKRLSEDVFPELAEAYTSCLPDVEWCLVTDSPLFSADSRMHFSRYLVTNEQFDLFLEDEDGIVNPQWWENLTSSQLIGRRNELVRLKVGGRLHPRVHVSFREARAYCRWVSYKTGLNVDLPSFSERCFAAARQRTDPKDGETAWFLYPWGDVFSSEQLHWCNFRGTGKKGTTPVNYFDKYYESLGGDFSIFGLSDLCGNAWELCYMSDDIHDMRVAITGGSWRSRVNSLRVDYYQPFNQDGRRDDIGFRILLLPKAVFVRL